jgi:hypothetical protein
MTSFVSMSSALACGNAMQLVQRGLFPTMFLMWLAGLVIALVVKVIDSRRAEPMSDRNRFRVGVAIVVMLSGAWTIYYAATVDSSDWRIWDKERLKGIHEVQGDVTF